MKRYKIYRVYNKENDKIFEGCLDKKEIQNFENLGFLVVNTKSYVKRQIF